MKALILFLTLTAPSICEPSGGRLFAISACDQRATACSNGLLTPADDRKFNCEGLRQEILRAEKRKHK